MNYLKSIIAAVALGFATFAGYAQATDEVTLTVSSDGSTKEEATKNALRSAIEQAYGTFVSANTTILNDELVKDEIVTIANGNIKSYEEISSTAMPDGSQFVTLKATVSVSKLISYAQSKGAETEFAGATFGMNLRLQEMNKENEKKVLDNLMTQIKEMLPYTYDRTLEVSDPVIDKEDDTLLGIKFVVTSTPNSNMTELQKLIETTLRSISLSDSEQEQYRKSGLKYYKRGELRHRIEDGNDNIYISLTDHINFAIERVKMGVPFQNPFLWEIKKFYYQEYMIGKAAIGIIAKKLKVTLPQDEAAFIALHIVNAELDLDMTAMVSMTKFVNHILDIVDECFGNRIDKESVFYERFVTHLKFFAQRIFAGKEVESDDTEFQEIIRNKYQDCIDCVEKIKAYIKETCNHDVTDEEMMYLTVHVKRVTTK